VTSRPTEPAGEPAGEVPANPETDAQGQPAPDQDQPAEVETGDVAQDPATPPEDPGVDPPVEDNGEPVHDPTQVAETEANEEPAGS
jgi:hypothetical protein